MNKLLLVFVCGMLAGCDYTVPLVKNPALPIDPTVVGLWQRTDAGQSETLLVLPLGKNEYMISYPAQSKDAMFARGCRCQAGRLDLVQLEWFGTAQGTIAENNKVFQFAAYTVTGSSLSVKLLNPDVVKRDAASSEALVQSIADNAGKTNLFRDEMVFKKITNKGE